MALSIPVTVAQPNTTQKVNHFIGFNTVDNLLPPYTLTDIDLVKQDLLNHLHTPVGSRVMLPTYGSHIYDYIFEPFDDYTKNLIIEDVTNIVTSDPRLRLMDVQISQTEHAIALNIVLLYVPQNVTTSLYTSFSTAISESF